MPTFSDGQDALSPTMSDFLSPGVPSIGDMRTHLQLLLDNKEKQLQQVGTLGQRILSQQVQLDERVRQLHELEAELGDDQDLDSEIRERYRELTEMVRAWDSDNTQLTQSFGPKPATNGTPSQASPRTADIPRDSERSKAGPSAAAQSRRAKNAAHRADDVEFAFEIGSGLLTEVRRLQSLLGERDKAIQDMKEEKDDLDKTIESLRSGLRSQEQSADKFKEENWNLEVTLQELRAQLSDSQASTQRLESEHKRLTNILAAAREGADLTKTDYEKLKVTFDEFKAKHETDIAQARKTVAGLQRDKSDLQQSLDSLKVEMQRNARRLPKFGSPLTPNDAHTGPNTPRDDEDDPFSPAHTAASTRNRKQHDTSALFPADELGFLDTSPDPSPLRPVLAPNHPSNEIEALQQRLVHAQRQISTLKGSLQREKEMRLEAVRKSADSPGYGPFDGDEENAPEGESSPPQRRLTPFRVGGRGRTRRGRGSLLARFGQAARSPTRSEYDDDEAPNFGTPPPIPHMPDDFQDPQEEASDREDHEDEDEINPVNMSPSVHAASKRVSVEGMDPAFANILRRSSSSASLQKSPMRRALSKATRSGTFPRRRGAGAYQQSRPSSLVGQPELLAAELGIGMDVTGEIDLTPLNEENNIVEMAETAVQTEYEEPVIRASTPPPPVPIRVHPPTSEMAIQVDPEPEPKPVAVDSATQTLPDVLPVLSDVAVQWSPAPPPVKEMETQTPRLLTAEVEIQTPRPSALPLDSIDPSMLPVPRGSRRTITLSNASRFTVTPRSLPGALYREDSGDNTVTYGRLSQTDDEDDGNDTETGIETETDADDYQDARASIGLATPASFDDADEYVDSRDTPLSYVASASQDDFHSIMTVTDNDYSSDSDDSLRATRTISRQGAPASPSITAPTPIEPQVERPVEPPPRPIYAESSVETNAQAETPRPVYASISVATEVPETPKPTYTSVAIETDIPEEPEVEVVPPESEPVVEPVYIPPPLPKPELKEISIQTDEWVPPAPTSISVPVPETVPVPATTPSPVPVSIPIPVPIPTPPIEPAPIPSTNSQPVSPKPGFLYRVGPSNQQFQLVSPLSSPNKSTPSPTSTPVPQETSIRDPNATILARTRSAHHDRRQSIESTLSAAVDDAPRARVISAPVDKSRPPMMVLPPPPKQPPPPTGSMGPPNFVPDRPPGRPLSPPPPELVQRATSPAFGSALSIPNRNVFGTRQHGSSMPPSQTGIRQPPSTSSFRSAINPAMYSQQSIAGPSVRRKHMSSTSLGSSHRSSLSSDHHIFADSSNLQHQRMGSVGQPSGPETTDPNIIHAITQTMIGEFLYKYPRKAIGKGYGDRRHKRFFWVHPYTKTLYWSSADPGSSSVSESSAKSAYIENVRSVLDPNPMPPGLHQYSVIVSTPSREMKFTAPTKERHDIWLNALRYLLARPDTMPPGADDDAPLSPMSIGSDLADERNQHAFMASPHSHRSGRSAGTVLSSGGDSFNNTPKGQHGRSQVSLRGSVGKRSGTPAAEYLRWTERETPYSPGRSYEHVGGEDEEDLSFELHEETMSDGGFEGLENVRACCDGRHTVGGHHHHHPTVQGVSQPLPHPTQELQPQEKHLRQNSGRSDHLDANPRDISRPVSPAWSFRSKTGSTHSNKAMNLFSKFGSRRGAKTPTNGDS